MKISPIIFLIGGGVLLLGRKSSSAATMAGKLPMPPPSQEWNVPGGGEPYMRAPSPTVAPTPAPPKTQEQAQAPANNQMPFPSPNAGPTWWDPYGGFGGPQQQQGQQQQQQDQGQQGPAPGSSDPSEWGSIDFNAYCSFMKNWPGASITIELKVLELINDNRVKGGSCGGIKFGPTHKLKLNALLTCSARAHAKDMWVRKFYANPDSHKSKFGTAHTNPSGVTSAMRMMQSGYKPSYTMEDIGYGHRTPETMVNGGQQGPGWMQSPSHCKAVLSPNVYDAGVGFYQESQNSPPMWVVDFAAPQ